jgi:tRNA pseudouridine32 synthase/23S rRNA pseudouridine746 synthase/23S rRNA pseudouridine1911/1915/1917 synthase
MSKKSKIIIPPKKFHPKGLDILHEDRDIIVVSKATGLLTISTDRIREKTAQNILDTYVKRNNQKSKARVFIVHRLDRDTSGLLIFAKTIEAKTYLQENWKSFDKKYYALVHGIFKVKEGTITSYLTENKAFKVYSTNDSAKGEYAETGYKVINEHINSLSGMGLTLLEITLVTGKKNQIRVHLSEKGYPIAGDKKYGSKGGGFKRLMLHAGYISFTHPFSKEQFQFRTKLPSAFKKF